MFLLQINFKKILIDYQIICGKTLEVKLSSISNIMKCSYNISLKIVKKIFFFLSFMKGITQNKTVFSSFETM